jgi:hypothetical protein
MMAPPERAAIPEPFKSNLEKLFHIYFDLKNALANDAPEQARQHGRELKEQLTTTAFILSKGSTTCFGWTSMKIWKKVLKSL